MNSNHNGLIADGILTRATAQQKEKLNFERQREIIDYIDTFYGNYRDDKRINKFKINYDLFNGKLDVKLYEDPLCFTVDKQLITFDYQNISHTPIISQISNALLGEQVNLPFKPMIKDNTPQRLSILKKRANKSLKNFFLNDLINPLRNQILQGILEKSGESDIFKLAGTPDAQLQLENSINMEISKELPRDIMEFVNGDFQSPTARQAQRMIDYLIDKFDIKFQQIEGFKHAIITGEEYYFVGELNGKLKFNYENPTYLTWGGGDRENTWSQKGDWVKRERWLTLQSVLSNHSKYLDKRDLEMLDFDVEPIGGYQGVPFWDRDKSHTKSLMWTYSTDEGFRNQFNDVNIKTKEGRQKLFNMYNVAFSKYGDQFGNNYSDYGIRECHVQWRDLRKMWVVSRKNEDGYYRDFWLPEHYEPTHLDENVRETWINQGWESWTLGTFDKVYVNIRPIPFQYKSMFNPHDVDLSYYGKVYNTHDNVTKNVALIDLPKSSQKNFDIILADIRKDMATSTGSAFTLFMNMKPEKWDYQEWLDLLRNANILMLDPTRSMGGVDPQFLRQINLGKMSDMAGKIQLLEFYRNQIISSMYFNSSREGDVSPYANTQNIQQNTTAVHNKTAYFFEQHRLVVEKALGGFLNRARHYYKDNLEEAAIFLDDISLADLKNSPISWYEWFGISLKNSQEELQKLNSLKSSMVPFIQNGASPEAIMELVFSDTTSEVQDVIRRETKRLEDNRNKDLEHQKQVQMENNKAISEEKSASREHELIKLDKTLKSQEKRTLWDREKFSMQQDIDKNQVNDIIQKTLLEIQGKMQMHGETLDLEKEKLILKERLDLEKLQNEKIKNENILKTKKNKIDK